jgi:predicted permease
VLLADFEAQRTALPQELLAAVQRVTGVVSASVSTHTPLSGARWSEPAVPAGQTLPERDTALFVGAGPRFFETMGIALLAGREFTEYDTASSPGVAVINERYAQRFFPKQNPLGQHLAAVVRGQKRDLEIVGIVKNTRVASLRAAPPSTVYVAYAQLTGDFPTTLEVRAAGPLGPVAAAVRGALQSRLPNAPIEVRQFSTQVSATLLQDRMMATLAGAFGILALTLVSVGLYGLLAYTVARRTREIGIRMALGAQRLRVVMLILNGAARLVVIGIVVGLPAAWAASRWVQSMLFGLTPTDPIAIVGATLLLAFVAQLAAYLPAWRASRVDPLTALRHE